MEERDLDPDPLRQFERWFEEARAAGVERAGDDGARDGDVRRQAVCADGAAEGSRRARLRLLHELREPQGRRAGGEPARGAALPLAAARPAGAGRGAASSGSRTRSRRRTSTPGRSAAGSPPGLHRRAGRWPIEPSSSGSTRSAATRSGRTYRCRRTGAGSVSSRTRTSSGSTATTACTTVSATSGTATRGRVTRLAP